MEKDNIRKLSVYYFFFKRGITLHRKSCLTHKDLDRYKEKIEACRGIDPYELVGSECS